MKNIFSKITNIWMLALVTFVLVLNYKKSKAKSEIIDIPDLDSSGSTLSVNEIDLIIQQLIESFNVNGTDEERIFAIFNKISSPDLAAIHNRFGRKTYSTGRVRPGEKSLRTLGYILREELSPFFDASTWNVVVEKYKPLGIIF